MHPAFLFPGQGSQYVGMGAALAADPACANRFAAAADVLGSDLLEVMQQGPLDTLTETRYAQPAIFLTSVAAADLLTEHGIIPEAVAGHSLGEYSALVVAGVLEFADALLLVRRRAEAMQAACDAHPGTMAAVLGLDADAVRRACAEAEPVGPADLANINAVGQVVISGSAAGVAAAGAAAKAAGAKRVMPLTVGGAFHSRLMQTAAAPLAAVLDDTPFRPPRYTFIPNTTGRPLADPAAIRTELQRQLTAPVCWAQTMTALLDAGVDTTFEVGPGKILTGMAKRDMPTVVRHAVESPESIAAAAAAVGVAG